MDKTKFIKQISGKSHAELEEMRTQRQGQIKELETEIKQIEEVQFRGDIGAMVDRVAGKWILVNGTAWYDESADFGKGVKQFRVGHVVKPVDWQGNDTFIFKFDSMFVITKNSDSSIYSVEFLKPDDYKVQYVKKVRVLSSMQAKKILDQVKKAVASNIKSVERIIDG